MFSCIFLYQCTCSYRPRSSWKGKISQSWFSYFLSHGANGIEFINWNLCRHHAFSHLQPRPVGPGKIKSYFCCQFFLKFWYSTLSHSVEIASWILWWLCLVNLNLSTISVCLFYFFLSQRRLWISKVDSPGHSWLPSGLYFGGLYQYHPNQWEFCRGGSQGSFRILRFREFWPLSIAGAWLRGQHSDLLKDRLSGCITNRRKVAQF